MGELITPKLSRELSALQLSPTTSSGISRSRGRTRSSSESQSSNSDTENEAPPNNVKKDSNFEMAEETVAAVLNQNQRKMLKNNPHFLRSKEAKVKKAASLSLPLNFEAVQATAGASPTTVMSLRPRPSQMSSVLPATPPNTNTGNRKRKSELLRTSCSTPTPSKSPRIVNKSKPVMTRSRTARVLQLKK